MTAISSTGSGLLDRIAASRAALNRPYKAPGREAEAPAQADPARAPTRVTLGSGAANDVVYAKPSAAAFQPQRAWASSARDDISSLMARNSANTGAVPLAERWRGLGGALLAQLADSPTSYKQTLADYVEPAADAAGAAATEAAADPEALRQQALSGVATQAATVELKVQTRSGQTLELSIAVNDGSLGGTRGLQVQLKSSGPLDSAEKAALAHLSEGLDRALEGLGQGAPQLDLAQLMSVDKQVFTSLDLKVEDPRGLGPNAAPGALGSFSLQLGPETKNLSMKGANGEMSIRVDAASPLGQGSAAQRRSAVDKMLQQIDAAAERGHADAQLVARFKDGFKQLQAPPADAAKPGVEAPDAARPAPSSPLKAEVDSLRSGLADFEASFSGATSKKNRYGGLKEQGHAEYTASQHTSSKPNSAGGGDAITETRSEKLRADYLRTRTLMLDPGSGNYDSTQIQDEKTVTTLIETAKNQVARALRKTDEHKRLSFDVLENHRVTAHHEAPQDRSYVERLR